MELKHDEATEEFLAHWGIKGQKWGRRRWQYKDGSLTPEGKKRYSDSDDYEVRGESKPENNAPRVKSVSEMSNKELQDAIQNLQLQKQFKQLQKELAAQDEPAREQQKRGESFVNKFMKEAVIPSATKVGKELIEKKLKEKLGLDGKEKDALGELKKEYESLNVQKDITTLKDFFKNYDAGKLEYVPGDDAKKERYRFKENAKDDKKDKSETDKDESNKTDKDESKFKSAKGYDNSKNESPDDSGISKVSELNNPLIKKYSNNKSSDHSGVSKISELNNPLIKKYSKKDHDDNIIDADWEPIPTKDYNSWYKTLHSAGQIFKDADKDSSTSKTVNSGRDYVNNTDLQRTLSQLQKESSKQISDGKKLIDQLTDIQDDLLNRPK